VVSEGVAVMPRIVYVTRSLIKRELAKPALQSHGIQR
jgi:hypothetical protein